MCVCVFCQILRVVASPRLNLIQRSIPNRVFSLSGKDRFETGLIFQHPSQTSASAIRLTDKMLISDRTRAQLAKIWNCLSWKDLRHLHYEVPRSDFVCRGDGRRRIRDFQTDTKRRKSTKINRHTTLSQVFTQWERLCFVFVRYIGQRGEIKSTWFLFLADTEVLL